MKKEFPDARNTVLFGKEVAVTKDGAVYIHSYVDKASKLRKGKWLKPTMCRGYHDYKFTQNGIRIHMKRHQVAMKVWGTEAPADMIDPVIDHIDSDKLNNHIDNLQWLERVDNTRRGTVKYENEVTFISPSNELHTVKNLSGFCKQHKLTQTAMCNVKNGKANHHKGWKLYQD